jgi:N-carbamoylputrescine amidase
MDKIRVAAISVRNLIGEIETSLTDLADWTRRAAGQGAELVLFPELNVTGHFRAPLVERIAQTIPGPATERITALAAETGTVIAAGLIEREGDARYCTHVLVGAGGILGRQRKIHVPAQEQPFWGAGSAIDVFDIGPARVGITICRDSFFDEMTRTLYFKGAEIVLMPFGYYNVPRSNYLTATIHGMSIIKACWTNGYYAVVCNSAESRPPSEIEPRGRKFPGWAGVFDPWGEVVEFVDRPGNDAAMVVATLEPERLADRRGHPNFLARELRPDLYRFT